MRPDIIVFYDHAIFDGQRINKRKNMSVMEWFKFWEGAGVTISHVAVGGYREKSDRYKPVGSERRERY